MPIEATQKHKPRTKEIKATCMQASQPAQRRQQPNRLELGTEHGFVSDGTDVDTPSGSSLLLLSRVRCVCDDAMPSAQHKDTFVYFCRWQC